MGCMKKSSLKKPAASKMVVVMNRICAGITAAYAQASKQVPTPDLASMNGVTYANPESESLAQMTITACDYIKAAKTAGIDLSTVPKLELFRRWHEQFDKFHDGLGQKPDVDAYVSAMLGEQVVGVELMEELAA
jgi:hypothetical protein